jgi:hypothetical protein
VTYDSSRDRFASNAQSPISPGRNWYTLADADIGAKELPVYGKALHLSIGAAVSLPLSIVVVPTDATDAATRTLTYTQAGEIREDRSVRRIVSIAGGTTVPAGLQIDIVTS